MASNIERTQALVEYSNDDITVTSVGEMHVEDLSTFQISCRLHVEGPLHGQPPSHTSSPMQLTSRWKVYTNTTDSETNSSHRARHGVASGAAWTLLLVWLVGAHPPQLFFLELVSTLMFFLLEEECHWSWLQSAVEATEYHCVVAALLELSRACSPKHVVVGDWLALRISAMVTLMTEKICVFCLELIHLCTYVCAYRD